MVLWLPFLLTTQSLHRPQRGRACSKSNPGGVSQRRPRSIRGFQKPSDDDARAAYQPICIWTHLSHQVFQELMDHEGWSKNRIWPGGRGQREGWWGMSRSAESFLDQLITWRELGYNMCAHMPLYDRYESLPAWAQESLDRHRNDPRPYLYGWSGSRTPKPMITMERRTNPTEARGKASQLPSHVVGKKFSSGHDRRRVRWIL